MFIGVTERQERQEHFFVADSEVIDQHFGRARGIVQDRAMMLHHPARRAAGAAGIDQAGGVLALDAEAARLGFLKISLAAFDEGSEEHTSELQSLMRISYAVFCLKKKKQDNNKHKMK